MTETWERLGPPPASMVPAFAICAKHGKHVILDLASNRRERRVSGIHSGTLKKVLRPGSGVTDTLCEFSRSG